MKRGQLLLNSCSSSCSAGDALQFTKAALAEEKCTLGKKVPNYLERYASLEPKEKDRGGS